MCYHLSINHDTNDLENWFGRKFFESGRFERIYHASAFDTPFLPVICNVNPDVIQFLQWGFIPFWTKNLLSANRIRLKTLNARSETIFTKPSFMHTIKKRRCLIIADGFYEWHHANGKTYPFYIQLLNKNLFSFAGLWDSWTDKDSGINYDTFSILTTEANPLLALIHNKKKRMPVILNRDDENRWLKNDLETSEIESMFYKYDEKLLKAYTVSRLISRRKTNTNIPEVMTGFNFPDLIFNHPEII